MKTYDDNDVKGEVSPTTAYNVKCGHCGSVYPVNGHKQSAYRRLREHELQCAYNPDNAMCGSCVHFNDAVGFEYREEYYNYGRDKDEVISRYKYCDQIKSAVAAYSPQCIYHELEG